MFSMTGIYQSPQQDVFGVAPLLLGKAANRTDAMQFSGGGGSSHADLSSKCKSRNKYIETHVFWCVCWNLRLKRLGCCQFPPN